MAFRRYTWCPAAVSVAFVASSGAVAQLPVGCPFFPVAPIPVGLGPQAVAAGDLDSDGDADLVIANTLDNTLTILRNAGGGAFTADPATLDSFGQPVAVAVGHLNGDAFADIAVANLLDDSTRVFLNDGAGGFGASTRLDAGDGPTAIALAAIAPGAALDIITANGNDGTISAFANDGAGNFGAAAHFSAGGAGPSGLAVDDAQNRILVSLLDDGAFSLLVEDGAGGFAAPVVFGSHLPTGAEPTGIAAGDFNNDGLADAAVANSGADSISVAFGQPGTAFAAATHLALPGAPHAVAAADVTGDSRPDIIATIPDLAVVRIFINNGSGSFPTSQTHATGAGPRGLSLMTLDGDTDLDIAIADGDAGTVSVLRNKLPALGGGFASFTIGPSGVEPRAVVFGDLDGDSDADLVAVNYASDDISVLINAGGGRYLAEERYAVGVDPRDAAIADLNADGRNDIVVANRQTDNISVLLNNGSNATNNRFAPQAFVPAIDAPVALSVGRLDDAGGVADIAAASDSGAGVAVLLNDGAGTFAAGPVLGAGASFSDVAVADLAGGDARLDVLVLSPADDTVRVFTNAGAFTPLAPVVLAGDEPVSVVAADLAPGPSVDAAVACRASGSVCVLQNDGSGVLTSIQNVAVAPGLIGISAGTIDAMAGIDLAVASESAGTAHVLINQGGGMMLPSLSLPVGMGASATALTDLDGDSRADLAVGNAIDNTAVVVVNLGFVPTVVPSFTQHPIVAPAPPIAPGANASISVVVDPSGNGPFFYAWRRNASNVSVDGVRITLNAANGTLSFTPVQAGDAGTYDVVVTDSCGLTATSNTAALTILGGDTDGDGVDDASDNCPNAFNPGQEDLDSDGVGDACDNCTRIANPGQQDTVGRAGCPAPDGVGDACDCLGDANRDGVVNFADITTVLTNFLNTYPCPAPPPFAMLGDADLDGNVAFADVTKVLTNFLQPCN